LDFHDAVERIEQGLSRDSIHLCFADASTNLTMCMIDASGASKDLVAPQCRFDRVFPVPSDCREALTREFRELMAYHRALAPSKRDYPRSMQELTADWPATTHPVLGRDNAVATDRPAEVRASFWKRLFGKSSSGDSATRPAPEPAAFDDLEHVVLFARENLQSFSPSDKMQQVLEEMTGRSIQELSQKARFQLFRNSGDTIQMAKKGNVAIIAAIELGLSLGDQDLPKRFIAGRVKATERYFRDPETGGEFAIVLLYRSDA
jgi:hypothetical protein